MQVEKVTPCTSTVVRRREAPLSVPMFGLDKTWQIDERLETDAFLIASDGAFQTRLMNDSRWPWIIVVPIVHDAVDIEDYQRGGMAALMGHLADISKTLKEMDVATSTNVATIGNIVKQMHWHVVGRNEGDPNWPNPVWGFEERVPYSKRTADEFIEQYKAARKRSVSILNRH